MKKILITFLLCNVYRSQAQDTFIQLPTTGDLGIITNIGVFHKPYITIGKETAYTDTVLINRYFQILAKKVNAKNVVLLVEYPMVNVSKGIITEDSTNSIWVTQEMRNLGFKKWMAADTRTIRDSALYFNSRKFLLSFIEKYIQIKEDTTKDLLGFTNFSFKERISIPEKILDTAMRALGVICQDMIFEENMKNLCLKLRSMDLIPITIAGSAHTLALKEPCIVQINQFGLELVKEEILFIKARQFLLKYFVEKIKDSKTGHSLGRFFYTLRKIKTGYLFFNTFLVFCLCLDCITLCHELLSLR